VPELPAVSPYRWIGHKGADLIAPGNTLASFDAAIEAGVDMIEFDVLPEDVHDPQGSRLLLFHDYGHDFSAAPTLEEGLAHLAATGVGVQVDLKWHGYESRVVDALRRHGLIDRALLSTMEVRSLPLIRALEPTLKLGWSVPRVKKDYTRSLLTRYPAYALLLYARRVLPGRAAGKLRAGEIDALMAHWLLITPRLVRAVSDAGGELYAWTVDDREKIAELERLGVTGIISNDPRLFAPHASG
jgi:glycerophosphoryl diester phosphodiesterase